MSPKVSPQTGFYALGMFCFGLGTQHALLEGRGLETVLESFIILSLAVLVLFTAYRLPNRDLSPAGRWRALLLSVGVAASFATLALAVWLTWSIRDPAREFSFLISFATVLGALVGTQGSLYAVAEEAHLKESQELSKLLMINQRVLRHNIRNELSIALGHLENLETVDDVEEIPETTEIIRRHLNELLETTERTREIVTIWENDDLHTFDLAEIVKTQVGQFREEYPEITISIELPEKCEVQVHPSLSLAIEEAVLNAIEHNSENVRITISVSAQRDETVIVEIADTGRGISAIDREAMEIPTETPLTHTEGLGMWTIYWVAIMSGGRVEFAENEPQGTVVRLILPQNSSLSSMFSIDQRDK